MKTLNIGIAGGGIGGLAAGVALGGLGHKVSVYEGASELYQIGAGIQLTPNATKHLLRWGVGKYLTELHGGSATQLHVRRWQDGSVVGKMTTEDHRERYGGPYIQVHRADLQQSLLKVARDNGVQVYTKSRVVDYDLANTAILLEDGRRTEHDLVLAADGVKSVARRLLSGADAAPVTSTGHAVTRMQLDMSSIEGAPEIVEYFKNSGLNLWIGPSKHVAAYLMRNQTMINLVLEYPEPRPQSEWVESRYVQEIQETFQDWDPNLVRMLHASTTASKWPLQFNVPLERWTSELGTVVLTGDAAHVVPSFLAQGAAMAIEDAATLAGLLSDVENSNDISKATTSFQEFRLQRKMKIQELSLQNLHLYHLPDGEDQQKRDTLDASSKGLHPFWGNAEVQMKIYGFDGLLTSGRN